MRRRRDSDLAELERLHPTLYLQMRVSRMLGFGFALTFAWAGGVGSLIAVIIGLRARSLIRQSGGQLVGMRMAWWCIVIGGLDAALMLPRLVWDIFRAVSR